MDKKIQMAIVKTIVYSDIFDYPLSKYELWKFLIGKKIDKEIFIEFFKDLGIEKVHFKNKLYFLYGRDKIVNIRIKRREESRKKIVYARKIIKKLIMLPTIQFIGISGALSLENSDKDDDIDLFVIASKGSLWLTRLAIIIFLLFMGRYRRRNDIEVSDKICLNMLIDETALAFSKIRQNLYTAHEIVQLMPIFERNDMYKKLMNANKWAEKFLPNSIDTKILGYKDIKRKQGRLLNALNYLAKKFQLWFIKKHITAETINDHFLAFHPFDYKKSILKEYNKRLKTYEV